MADLLLYVSTVVLAIANLCLSSPAYKSSAINSISSEEYKYRIKYAAQMLSFMNRSVDPCDDFYEYSCGNWKNVIDDRITSMKRSNYLDINYKLFDVVSVILQRPNINDVAPEYAEEFELAKKIYHNCLEAELYPMRESAEYLAVLKEIGGFPAIESNWNSKNFNWLNMSAHLSNYGINSFVNEHIIPQYPFLPYFTIPALGFDELHTDTVRDRSSKAYLANEKRMRDILTIYGVKESRIKETIAEIFDFIEEILLVIQSFNEDEDECKKLQTFMADSKVTELAEKWQVYNEIAWSGKNYENYSKEYQEDCLPCYYLYEKIDKISEKRKEAAANYLSLQFLFHIDVRVKDTKYQKDYCISKIKSSMNVFIDHLYMKLYFDNELREEITGMVKEIRESLRFLLQNANWLDESTRETALLKESRMKEHIGRYENEAMTKLLIGELKKLKFVEGSYEKTNLNLRIFTQYIQRFNGLNFEKLGHNTKPLDLLIGMQANSFYYNIDNSINIMAGFLMEPVYNKAWPNSLKFGTLGSVIGHEFTHGFDTIGANYDEANNIKYWWSNKSSKMFEERAKCYVDHYQSYSVPEINRRINGYRTLNENIADGGGLKAALLAYRRYIRNLTKQLNSVAALYKKEQMPGIDLTPEQLFFLGFAQLRCASYKEADYWAEHNSIYVIDKYRVLGTLSNNVDFAKSYNCPLGSKMNPTMSKCEVW